MVTIKKIQLFTKANICYCDICINNIQNEVILHYDIVLKYKLKNNITIEESLYNSILEDNLLLKAKNLAYTFAAYKMRTEFEVRQRLKQKDYSQNIIQQAIEFLYEFNLLDDSKYANLFVKEKSITKVWGVNRIKNELFRKGVDENIIESAIANFFPKEDSFAKAIKIAEKKYKILCKKYDIRKSQQLLYGFLQRKGFNSEIIKSIIQKLST